jgi:hypothetical protein
VLLEHDPGLLGIIGEQEDIHPEGVRCGREIKDGAELRMGALK